MTGIGAYDRLDDALQKARQRQADEEMIKQLQTGPMASVFNRIQESHPEWVAGDLAQLRYNQAGGMKMTPPSPQPRDYRLRSPAMPGMAGSPSPYSVPYGRPQDWPGFAQRLQRWNEAHGVTQAEQESGGEAFWQRYTDYYMKAPEAEKRRMVPPAQAQLNAWFQEKHRRESYANAVDPHERAANYRPQLAERQSRSAADLHDQRLKAAKERQEAAGKAARERDNATNWARWSVSTRHNKVLADISNSTTARKWQVSQATTLNDTFQGHLKEMGRVDAAITAAEGQARAARAVIDQYAGVPMDKPPGDTVRDRDAVAKAKGDLASASATLEQLRQQKTYHEEGAATVSQQMARLAAQVVPPVGAPGGTFQSYQPRTAQVAQPQPSLPQPPKHVGPAPRQPAQQPTAAMPQPAGQPVPQYVQERVRTDWSQLPAHQQGFWRTQDKWDAYRREVAAVWGLQDPTVGQSLQTAQAPTPAVPTTQPSGPQPQAAQPMPADPSLLVPGTVYTNAKGARGRWNGSQFEPVM